MGIRMRLRAKVYRKKKAVKCVDVVSQITDLIGSLQGTQLIKLSKSAKDSCDTEHKDDTSRPSDIYKVGIGADSGYEKIYDQQALNEVLIERCGSCTAMIM